MVTWQILVCSIFLLFLVLFSLFVALVEISVKQDKLKQSGADTKWIDILFDFFWIVFWIILVVNGVWLGVLCVDLIYRLIF